MAQGYTGPSRSLQRVFQQLSAQKGAPITDQTVILVKVFSARSAALTFVRAPERQTKDQKAFVAQVCQVDPTIAAVYRLAQDFGQRLAQARREEPFGTVENCSARLGGQGTDQLCGWVDR